MELHLPIVRAACLAVVPPSAAVDAEVAQRRRGISPFRYEDGWCIERSDPAKFDLRDFPLWDVERERLRRAG